MVANVRKRCFACFVAGVYSGRKLNDSKARYRVMQREDRATCRCRLWGLRNVFDTA